MPLARDISLQRPPVWGFVKPADWEVVVFDQQGLNKWKRADGCTLSTVQTAGTIPPIDQGNGFTTPPTDATATKVFLESGVKETERTLSNVGMLGGITSLPIGVGTDPKERIEFAQVKYTYTDKATAAPWVGVVAARVMPTPGSRMVATLTCPAASIEEAVGVLSGLRVLPG